MKPFQSYIFELNKPYEFRIKLATIEPKGEVMEQIKNALNTFQLESVSAVKSLPIQEHREFPKWGACECWQFDIKIAYPTTSTGVRQIIKERAHLNPDWICVRTLGDAVNTDEAEARGKDHEGALLDEEELKADAGGQELAGQLRIGSLIKELESRKFDFAATEKTTGVMSTESVGTTSPVGTNQNKVYKAKGK
jgi:hypothetical protein